VKLNHKHYSLIDKALSRRSFLAGAGGVAAASMLSGCSNDGTTTVTAPPTSAYTDADVLNFALNLEYLEAQFYLYAATGSGLAQTDTSAPTGYTGKYSAGTVITSSSTAGANTVGKAGVTGTGPTALTAAQSNILNEIAFEEQEHVRFLRLALGPAAVPMPMIDLTFFGVLGGVLTPAQTGFNPFLSFTNFLLGSFIFEDVGVTAYLGAAPLISAAGVASGYLTAASGILAVEAYHAAYARTSITATGSSAVIAIANSIAALRATLTVGNTGAPTNTANTGNTGQVSTAASVEVPLTLPTAGSTTPLTTITAADSKSSLAFARTVNQVHHVVYGSATVGTAKGGFFPNGTNSIFSTTTA
jgi:hypothetical protein